MRWALAVGGLGVGLVASCASSSTGGEGGACTSHYVHIADAPSRSAIKAKLLDVRPHVRSLRVIDDARPDKVTVNLINRRDRLVMSLDVWRKDDGSWTAERWSQCID